MKKVIIILLFIIVVTLVFPIIHESDSSKDNGLIPFQNMRSVSDNRNVKCGISQNIFSSNSKQDRNDYRIIESIMQFWSYYSWINDSKITYVYSHDDLLSEMIASTWNVSSHWIYDYKYESIYNDNALEIEKICYSYENNEWVYSSKQNFFYNDNNELIENLIQQWINEEWVNELKITNTLENGNCVEILHQRWIDNSWVNDVRELRSFTGDVLIEQLYQDYDSDTWINDFKISHSYENGLVIERIRENWLDNQWDYYRRDTWEYDDNGNCIENLSQYWENEHWQNSSISFATYSIENLMIDFLIQTFESNAWNNSYYYTYEYDANGNMTAYICQHWQNENWINHSKRMNVYEQYTDSNELLISDNPLSNYPNPFNPKTEIRFQISDFREVKDVKIKIYNLKGQKIKTIAYPSESLNMNEGSVIWNGKDESNRPVSSGVYFYKLKVNGKTEAVKKCLLLK